MNNYIHDKVKAKVSSNKVYSYSCATYKVVVYNNRNVNISLLPEHPDFLSKEYIFFYYLIEGRIYNTIMDRCGGNPNVIVRSIYK